MELSSVSSFPPSDCSFPPPSPEQQDEIQCSWRVWVCAFLRCVQINHKRHAFHLSWAEWTFDTQPDFPQFIITGSGINFDMRKL